MENYVVRIYRREGSEISGVVEAVENELRTAFSDGAELLALLAQPPQPAEHWRASLARPRLVGKP